VLLLGTVRFDWLKFNLPLLAQLADRRCNLPTTQITLQTLNRSEVFQVIEAIVGEQHDGKNGGEQQELIYRQHSPLSASPASKAAVIILSDFLFAQTGGLPLYLLEMLKLLQERELLTQQLSMDGSWRLEPTQEMIVAIGQEQSRHALVPPSVRAMIQVRLARLSQSARQLVMVSAVLRKKMSAQCLWQAAKVSILTREQGMVAQADAEPLAEAVESGLLREEAGVANYANYSIANDLTCEVIYTELSQMRRQIINQHISILRSE